MLPAASGYGTLAPAPEVGMSTANLLAKTLYELLFGHTSTRFWHVLFFELVGGAGRSLELLHPWGGRVHVSQALTLLEICAGMLPWSGASSMSEQSMEGIV